MIRDTLENLGNKIPPFFRKPVVFLLILFIIFFICFGIIFIYGNSFFFTFEMCKVEDITYHSDYGYFSVNGLPYGNIKPETKVNGKSYLHTLSVNDEEIKLAYDPENKTWSLVNPIDDVIHFKLGNPDTGKIIEGNFTPNITIINNNFYSDFLIVNWRDTEQNGSCYRIRELVTSRANGVSKTTDHGIGPFKYEKSLGINQYDEIRTNILLSLPHDLFNDSLIFEQEDEIVERSCTGPYSEGSNFVMHFLAQ